MMAPIPQPLPEYENPPVSEVVVSLEFTPLAKWHGPHAGLYWGLINKEYPRTEAQPPVVSQIEKYGEDFWQRAPVPIQMLAPDMVRTWFITESGTSLIQVQNDRFITNWRKVRGDERYPRYEKEVRPRFVKELARFKRFLAEQELGQLDVQQCELTYVNDILRGEGWDEFQQALTLFSRWTPRGSDGFLPSLESMTMSGSFLMPGEQGRLRFSAQHVLRGIDNREAVQLKMIARGKPASSADRDLLAWMDFAREWIVRGFTDLTSPIAHKIWKRTR